MAEIAGGAPTLLQQQMATDPRMLLAKTLAGIQANQPAQTLYSPWQGLAKAFTDAMPGVMQANVAGDYRQRQADLAETMAKALAAGQKGVPDFVDPGTLDPATGQVTGAGANLGGGTRPGMGAVSAVLAGSSDPIAKEMALQYGIQDMATQQAVRAALAKELVGKGQTPAFDANGNITGVGVIPGAAGAARTMSGATAGGEAQAKADVDLAMKPQIEAAINPALIQRAGGEAGAKAAAELPFAGPKAGAEAAAKVPYEVVPVHGVGAFPKSTVLGTGRAGTAAPAAPAGLPTGARQIGTVGGKPVYQTPDGKRFVEQ